MEAVRAFNNELSSLYEMRPPISRAKMANVTKCGIKAIKFYKHVVQSVEKFIQKCKPEYKVPGLYVIDSIVRQSRHQFNTEKDVFAPRFTKNIVSTFQNLFKCPPEEKSKVVRVLNLWQKNGVFPMEVVQPLLDLAADPNNVELVLTAQRAVERVVNAQAKSHGSASQSGIAADKSHVDNSKTAESIVATQNDMLATVTKLLQQTDDQGITSLSAQQHQLQQLQILQQQLMQQTELMQKPQESGPVIDSNLLAQIQTLTNQLLSKTGAAVSDNPPPEPGFNKKLLDFDYGESDDEDDKKEGTQGMQQSFPMSNVQNILNDPNLMQHIHQMSQTMQKNEITVQEQLRQQVLQQQQEEFDKEIKQGPPPGFIPIGMQRLDPVQQQMQQQYRNYEHSQPAPDSSVDVEALDDRDDDKDDRHRAHRDRSRSRSPRKRRRSRSRSRDRRRRSRSRDRHRRSRSRDRDREKTKEKERERRKKGLPPLREKHLSVCTTTLWLGHLTKHTTEEDIRTEIEKYGTVNSVNLIPPRGCAYVDYARRKDAYKARDKLDRGIRINGNILKVSWAQGIGVKNQDYKDMWNVDHGVTYIPWSKLPSDLNQLCGGGMIDEDTLPEHLKGMKFGQSEEESHDATSQVEQTNNVPMPMGGQPQYAGPMPGVVPVMPQMGVMPPMMMPMPGQMPGPMPPGMPPQHIRMPPGPPPGMPPQMTGLTAIGGAPPTSQPVPPSSVLAVSSAISSAPLTMSAASAQLSQAIQSILSTSIPSGQQPQPPSAAATIVAQPGIPPQARFQGFNPGFNPNMPPPPNIRLPMVGGPGMMPAGLRPQFVPTSQNIPAPSTLRAVAAEGELDEEDENMDIQDTDERSLSNPEIQTTAGQPPNFAMSRPSAPIQLQPGGPMIRGQVTRPVLVGQQHGIGIPMRPMLQMNMGERPRMMIAGDFRSSVPQTVIGTSGAARPQGPTSLMQAGPESMRPFLPRGAPGPGMHRPGLLGLRPGFGSVPPHFGSPQGHPGGPQNFRGPRPPFRPNGPPVEGPFMEESPAPNYNRGDIDDREHFSGPRPLMEIETDHWNPNDPDRHGPSDNPLPPENFGRRDFDRMDDDFEGMGNPPYRFGTGRGRSRDFGRDRDRDFRRERDLDRGEKDRDRGFGRDQGFRDSNRYERSPRSDRSYDRERDRDRDRDRDRRSRHDSNREHDRDKDRARESDRVQEPKVTKSRDRSGRQSRWSDGPAASESDLLEKSTVDLNPAEVSVPNSESKSVPNTIEPSQIENEPATQNDTSITTSTVEASASAEIISVAVDSSDNNISSTEVTASEENKSQPVNDSTVSSEINVNKNGSDASNHSTINQSADNVENNLPVTESVGEKVKSIAECKESIEMKSINDSDCNTSSQIVPPEMNGPDKNIDTNDIAPAELEQMVAKQSELSADSEGTVQS